MTYSPILIPVVVLVAWSSIICLWMLAARGAAFRRMGVTLSNIPDGARGSDLDGKGEDRAQWKSHNYNHLMEQPTLFYAIAITLALMDFGGGINYWLAWGYVGLRIIHSLIQATTNVVRYRLPVFLLATLCLIGLTIHAGVRILHDCGLIG
jgi:hypothetical protein